MFYEEHSNPPPGLSPVPPSHPPSDDEALLVFTTYTSLDQFTRYFHEKQIPLQRQRELLLRHLPRMWDLSLAKTLLEKESMDGRDVEELVVIHKKSESTT